MLPLAADSVHSAAGPAFVLVALGFAVGVVGHLTRSRLLVVVGILVIAVVSAYFTFGLAKVDFASIQRPF